MEGIGKEDFRKFIVYWSNLFPVDLWWRRKNNVSFNSPQHRESCPIDMYFDYAEQRMVDSFLRDKQKRDNDMEDYEITGRWLNHRRVVSTREEVDKWFEDFDPEKFNKQLGLKPEKILR